MLLRPSLAVDANVLDLHHKYPYEIAASLITDTSQARPAEQLTIEVVDPVTAEHYLSLNMEGNRTIRQLVVAKYATQMIEGHWPFTAAPIMFERGGRLIDGQHRLSAIMKAQVPVCLAVLRGASPSTVPVIDSGIIRVDADAVRIAGVDKFAREKATLARLLMALERGRTSTSGLAFARNDVVEYVLTHDIQRAVEIQRERGDLPFTPAALSAIYYRTQQIDPEMAEEFWVNQVCRALGLSEGSPALALRKRIGNSYVRTRGRYAKADITDQIGYATVAWNHFRAGRTITNLGTPNGGFTSKTFPQPR